MAQEIERKFLVNKALLGALPVGQRLCQGYIPTSNSSTVRVRIAGDQAFLTLKGPSQVVTRSEFEYPIPLVEAEAMLQELCESSRIEKTRYLLEHEGHTWELDVFADSNEGLLVAELELEDENEAFARPPWLGEEVSHDPRYFNSNLVKQPFATWGDE